MIIISFNLATHQGRAHSQREMFEAGMSLESIKYFLNYLRDAQTESHIVNLLIECAANRCGCKKDEAHLHLPEWIAADVPLQLRKLVAP